MYQSLVLVLSWYIYLHMCVSWKAICVIIKYCCIHAITLVAVGSIKNFSQYHIYIHAFNIKAYLVLSWIEIDVQMKSNTFAIESGRLCYLIITCGILWWLVFDHLYNYYKARCQKDLLRVYEVPNTMQVRELESTNFQCKKWGPLP